MALGFLKSLFGSYSDKVVKRHLKTVEQINAMEPEFKKLSDAELAQKTVAFRERLANGETLEQLLPEAFATVREAAVRTLGQRHYDVQLVGGMVLHEGNIAEMKTGEGKTLVATAPAYLNALTGKGVHVVTVNDYLARRDSEWMGQVYRFLGLEVGLVVHGQDAEQKRRAYAADITYGTNNEFGFDYLRDNMVHSPAEMVQRGHAFGIVDEVDSILIDEARTPLIISGPGDKPTDLYYVFAKLVERLEPEVDFEVDEKARTVVATEEGIAKIEKWLGVSHLYDEESQNMSHFLNNALKARTLFKRDRDYVNKDGEIIIVDEFTGRLMFGRRYSEGLHQAIEAKEGVKIERESQTLATVTFQNYFRMYKKLSGMTGTALTEEDEFREIYNLDVIVIPTNRPLARVDHPDVVYKTIKAKYNAVIEDVVERHATGQPVLVGTVSIEKSETLSAMLKRRGIRHSVLNAKNHESEAEIVAQAGRLNQVTIATNMAGRGTDILLGGNPSFIAKDRLEKEGLDYEQIRLASEGLPSADPEVQEWQQRYKQYLAEAEAVTEPEAEKVRAAGGLHIIGTERHESRRIDNQLRGRAGRQGDPGSSRFYVALEDDLMRLFGGEAVSNLMERFGIEEDLPIDHGLVSRAIENAQKKVEARNFDIRKHVLRYDDVMNQQREQIYGQRRRVLEGDNLRESFTDMIRQTVESYVNQAAHEEAEWDRAALLTQLRQSFLPEEAVSVEELEGLPAEEVIELVYGRALAVYEEKEARLGPDVMRQLERAVLLRTVDEKWIDHLDAMDDLREGIGLRAYAQRDPLVEYRLEATDMFNYMIEMIREDAVSHIFRLEVVRPQERRVTVEIGSQGAVQQAPASAANDPYAGVGRNDPCPCGSGKKFKRCHGAAAAGN